MYLRGIVVHSRFWTKLFSMGKASAITVFPFIFVGSARARQDDTLMTHERIHLAQALEMLVVPFYVCYIVEFGCRWLKHRNFDRAYRNISFEREAYAHQHEATYWKTRPFWAFRRYLIK